MTPQSRNGMTAAVVPSAFAAPALAHGDGLQSVLTRLRGERAGPAGPAVTSANFNTSVQAGRLAWTGPVHPTGEASDAPVGLLLLRASASGWRFRAGAADVRFETQGDSLRVTLGDATGVTLHRP